MADKREFKESPFEQGEDEVIARELTVPTSWGTATFTSLSSALYEGPDGDNDNVTSTKMTGSTSVSGQVITTPAVFGLTDGKKYRLEVKWVSSEGNTLEPYAIINAVR